jgi:hypothetical protein
MAPTGFFIGQSRFPRSLLTHSLPPEIFHTYFQARGNWAIYQPAGEKLAPAEKIFSKNA